MAVGILRNLNIIRNISLNEFVFVGELSLNGNLNKVNGILAMCIECRKIGIKSVFIPFENKEEAGVVDGINIYPARNLREVVEHINGTRKIEKFRAIELELRNNIKEGVDFSDIRGQQIAKRALEIVVAGFHNCLMIGSPGCGKTMLGRATETILPQLTFDKSLETTTIHSVAGILKKEEPLIKNPPFRRPHHTISKSAFCGGGRNAKPGEVSLAHNGVLYLDEIAEFDRAILESLRTPLEDGKITISRMNNTISYPSKFILLASMNPCPCGYYMDQKHQCVCSEIQISRYLNKISGPLLDRIDMYLDVVNLEYSELKKDIFSEKSESIRIRVEKARKMQEERYKDYRINFNSELTKELIEKFCVLDEKCNELLEKFYEKYSLNARSVDRIIKVARTIADLDNSEKICFEHLAEAIQYKNIRFFNRGEL